MNALLDLFSLKNLLVTNSSFLLLHKEDIYSCVGSILSGEENLFIFPNSLVAIGSSPDKSNSTADCYKFSYSKFVSIFLGSYFISFSS